MAFSYSDKNFTVVANLCFGHIMSTKTGYNNYVIPPAIVDRMLQKTFCIWCYATNDDASKNSGITATIKNGTISFTSSLDYTYLIFFFPIDSNK